MMHFDQMLLCYECPEVVYSVKLDYYFYSELPTVKYLSYGEPAG